VPWLQGDGVQCAETSAAGAASAVVSLPELSLQRSAPLLVNEFAAQQRDGTAAVHCVIARPGGHANTGVMGCTQPAAQYWPDGQGSGALMLAAGQQRPASHRVGAAERAGQ